MKEFDSIKEYIHVKPPFLYDIYMLTEKKGWGNIYTKHNKIFLPRSIYFGIRNTPKIVTLDHIKKTILKYNDINKSR